VAGKRGQRAYAQERGNACVSGEGRQKADGQDNADE